MMYYKTGRYYESRLADHIQWHANRGWRVHTLSLLPQDTPLAEQTFHVLFEMELPAQSEVAA